LLEVEAVVQRVIPPLAGRDGTADVAIICFRIRQQ